MKEAITRATASGLLAVAVLYATILPHELGHAIGAWAFGCKANWWQTDMSWFLWGSFGGVTEANYECLRGRGGPALAFTDGAGIAVNLASIGVASIVGRWWRPAADQGKPATRWIFVATVWWALANYAEAFSYLLLNTIWLKSDMQTVVMETGVSRWVWFTGGLVGAVALARVLRGPVRSVAAVVAGRPRASSWYSLVPFILYVAAVGITMAVARIRLT